MILIPIERADKYWYLKTNVPILILGAYSGQSCQNGPGPEISQTIYIQEILVIV